MNAVLRSFGVLMLLWGAGRAPAVASPAHPAGAADVDPVLQQLEQAGKQLKDFSANLKLTETDNALGNSTIRTGKVWFQKKPDGGARIHVIFDHRIDEERKLSFPDKVEYLLDGAWLTERHYQGKSEVRREVLRPGQKMDLFKLGEGPFPQPIGQDPADVHKQFQVRRVAPAKDDPPHGVHVELMPRPGTDLAQKFHALDVWLDERSHMPVRVDTVDAKQQTTRSTELGSLVVNPPGGLKDADFALPNIDNDHWNRHEEALNDRAGSAR